MIDIWTDTDTEPPVAIRDVYAHPAYGHSAELIDKGSWECAFDSASGILYPYIRRPVADTSTYYDTITPYGYGGIYAPPGTPPSALDSFRDEYLSSATSRGLIAEVARLSPLEPHAPFTRTATHVVTHTTYASWVNDPEVEFKAVSGSHRTSYRRSRRDGVTVSVLPTENLLDPESDFRRIYADTMSRVEAREELRLPTEYFRRLSQLPSEAIRLATASVDGGVVAGAIFLVWGNRIHYHLSGSTLQGRRVQATSALIEFAKRELVEPPLVMHLGGGLNIGDDLDRFKRRCSTSILTMRVAKTIVNPEIYASLTGDRASAGQFPAYRARG